jgi:hypothetical protein
MNDTLPGEFLFLHLSGLHERTGEVDILFSANWMTNHSQNVSLFTAYIGNECYNKIVSSETKNSIFFLN